ncbi:MAG: hypothetical protein ABMA01_09925 [Chthoniobacteraceae bacterium]
MSRQDWTQIPGRLRAAGFTIFYDRISYEPEHPLWCARASRDGREWSTLGSDLGAAFVELERQTQEPAVDWRTMIAIERSDTGVAENRRAN